MLPVSTTEEAFAVGCGISDRPSVYVRDLSRYRYLNSLVVDTGCKSRLYVNLNQWMNMLGHQGGEKTLQSELSGLKRSQGNRTTSALKSTKAKNITPAKTKKDKLAKIGSIQPVAKPVTPSWTRMPLTQPPLEHEDYTFGVVGLAVDMPRKDLLQGKLFLGEIVMEAYKSNAWSIPRPSDRLNIRLPAISMTTRIFEKLRHEELADKENERLRP